MNWTGVPFGAVIVWASGEDVTQMEVPNVYEMDISPLCIVNLGTNVIFIVSDEFNLIYNNTIERIASNFTQVQQENPSEFIYLGHSVYQCYSYD